jgi:NAD(P)-dependent dehydrogenase (short-subunit alcohol dehydrogenase family)
MNQQYHDGYLTRMGRPDDVAECCVYLASKAGEYVTGANFIIDGGMSIHGTFPPGPKQMRSLFSVGDEKGK